MNPKPKQSIYLDPQNLALPVEQMLRSLAEFYPIHFAPADGAIEVIAELSENASAEISATSSFINISANNLPQLGRAILDIISGNADQGKRTLPGKPFENMGIMLDCSRNAVMKVSHFKRWLAVLALLGYNLAMLYTEDTYQLPGEDFFGYQRGAYSEDELREIDDYAHSLGIEMVGCIQTLGHMEQVLKWNYYRKVKDTPNCLLIDEEETYTLIEKMIALFAKVFRSKRIHVGMDEVWGLGRGEFTSRFGHQGNFEIMNRHLQKVTDICQSHQLKPMLWSDMYFRMATTEHNYYDANAKFSDEVKNAIPKQAELVYWDYYNPTEKNYLDKIAAHENLHSTPIVASGVWTWGGMVWYGTKNTEANATPCITACKSAKVSELFFTLWGDDGAYCEFDSALAGLTFCANYAWLGADGTKLDYLESCFESLVGASYKLTRDAGDLNQYCAVADTLWDDPLLRIYYKMQPLRKDRKSDVWFSALENYESILDQLEPVKQTAEPIDYAHLYNLLSLARDKIIINHWLDRAYPNRKKQELAQIVGEIPAVIEKIELACETFRRQWYKRNKPQGFEVIQIRLGGLRQRFIELQTRLTELLEGKIDSIPELDHETKSYSDGHFQWGGYCQRATASFIL